MKKMIYNLILSALMLNIPIGFASPISITNCTTTPGTTITVCQNPSVTINAINDAATITVDSSTQPTVNINLIANDAGAGSAFVSNPNGLYGSLINNGSGQYTYSLNMGNPAVRALTQGQTLTDTFSYEARAILDPRVTATAQLTITINGPSIIPIAYPVSVSIPIDLAKTSASTTINVLDGNINAGSASLTSSTTGRYGYLDLGSAPSLGKYTYNVNLNNKDVIALTSGQTLVDTFSYSIRPPGNGTSTAQSTITVTLIGATIAPVANPIVANVQINPTQTTASISVDVLANANNAINASVSNTVGQYGYLDLGSNPSAGKYTYNVNMNNPAVKALVSGQQLTETFTYTVKALGNSAATAQSTITINILGTTTYTTPFKAADYVLPITATSTSTTAVTVTGNLQTYNATTANPTFSAAILSSLVGSYGQISFNSASKDFTYTLNSGVSQLQTLMNGGTLQDTFAYSITNSYGVTAQANIIININSNHQQTVINDSEVELNDNSNLATPLNAGVYMDGSLNSPLDRDFYSITSSGNETLNFQLCPTGLACNGKNAWVLYVFDGNKLTQAMQAAGVPLTLRRDDGGTTGPNGEASYFPFAINTTNMYLLNEAGIFDDAKLAIIDPCFGDGTSKNVGLPILPPGTTNTYYVAISAPLLRTTAPTTGSPCGSGSVVLTKPGPSVSIPSTSAGTTTNQTVATTQQYVTTFPYNTDQYTFLMTRSGVSPVATNPSADQTTYNSNTGSAAIPKVRVNNQLYSVQLQQSAPTALSQTNFSITGMQALSTPLTANPYQGIYNPANNQVYLPKVAVPLTSKSYSVKLQYVPSSNSLQFLSSIPLD